MRETQNVKRKTKKEEFKKGSPEGGDVFLEKIKKGKIPKHVAIIMDGNGRWAHRRGLPRLAGHRAGVESIRRILQAAHDVGVKHLTLYAFSIENWQRPKSEVRGLMRLLKETVNRELAELNKNDIKLNILGRWQELPSDVVAEIKRALETTAHNKSGVLNLALNYGGHTEIVDAVKKIVSAVQEGKEDPAKIDSKTFEKYLYSVGIPAPDLLIRTSGELRISNFLLWQIAYTEIWVTPVLWPDFGREHFFEAIADFQKRKRRYGGLDKDV